MMYVSGNFLFEHIRPFALKAVARGAKVKFLLADPNGQFSKDIETTEINGLQRKKPDTVSKEISNIVELYRDTDVEIRHYSTEYRMPMILAYDHNGALHAWLTLTFPPYKSIHSFVLRGTLSDKERSLRNGGRLHFLETMEFHFDTVWNQSKDAFQTSRNSKKSET